MVAAEARGSRAAPGAASAFAGFRGGVRGRLCRGDAARARGLAISPIPTRSVTLARTWAGADARLVVSRSATLRRRSAGRDLAGIAGAAGLLLTRLRTSAVVLAFPIAYFIVAGSGYRVFARDMLPVLPFLCITAGWLTVAAVRAVLSARDQKVRSWATAAVALAIVAPSARDVVLLDRLLTRRDNRVVVARELPGLIPQGSLVYHSGETYGRIPFNLSDPPLKVDLCDFDEATGQFTRGGRLPDWVILQRSPLVLYSRVPEGVQRIVDERYERVREFAVARDSRPRFYDQQDALFLPLNGLGGIERMGPALVPAPLREIRRPRSLPPRAGVVRKGLPMPTAWRPRTANCASNAPGQVAHARATSARVVRRALLSRPTAREKRSVRANAFGVTPI